MKIECASSGCNTLDVSDIFAMVLRHDEYLKKIDKIALCDPEIVSKQIDDLFKSLKFNSLQCEALLSRIRKIEDKHKFLESNWVAIKRLEEDIKQFNEIDSSRLETINILISKISKLEEITKRINEDDIKSGKIPYKCPVCQGMGKSNYALLSIPPIYPICPSCEGKGVIWG